MKLFFCKIILLFLVISSGSFAQRLLKITVVIDGKEEVLSYLTRRGNTYVSAKELGSILSANIYYNNSTSKLDIKFPAYTLKCTAKNQFFIITKRSDSEQRVFQIPVSTLLINDDVFVPITYSTEYFSLCFGRKILYENSTKTLSVTGEQVSEESFLALEEKISQPQKESPAKEAIGMTVNSKYDIYGLSIDEKSNGTLIRLKASRNVNIPRHSIGNNTLYVFLANSSVSPDIVNNIQPKGFVKKIKRTVISPKNVQLEFTLKEGYSTSEAFRDIQNNDILITIHNRSLDKQRQTIDDFKSKWNFDTIVLDAGHGGKDPGAIGVTGVKEKDINLGIVIKLGKLIAKNFPSIKVVYTRKTDDFVELYKRGKIANDAEGKLFISIHCNSTPQKDVALRGSEVYLLRPGRTKEAIDIAEFENSVIKYEDNPQRYQKLTDENFILVSMAHSQYMRYSEKFSDLIDQDWGKHSGIPFLGIKQAGFYVLVGASMPGVLIETGFLSNRKDEAYLKSSKGQSEIVASIFDAIKKYKDYYDKQIDYSAGH